MTDTEINIAIAEACGWTCIRSHDRADGENYQASVAVPDFWTKDDEQLWQPPKYCHDLNAMHEAENHIPDALWQKYISFLRAPYIETTKGFSGDGAYSATARQRAEAFLRTIGKWKD